MMKVTFCKEIEDHEIMYSLPIYFNSKIEVVVNDLRIDDSLTTSYKITLLRTQTKNNISINVFRYKNKEAYPIYLLKTFFKSIWN